MLMNYYRAIDRTEYQFDFLVHRQERGDYDDEIESMGGKIYRAFPIRPWKYCAYFRYLDGFFCQNAEKYMAVNAHMQENSYFVFKYASKYGIKTRICTAHTSFGGFDYKNIFRLYARFVGERFTTIRLACGPKAGEFLYRKRPFLIMNNAINAELFAYNSFDRTYRTERGWENKLVIGNIARFQKLKNHKMAVDVFHELHNRRKDSILVFVGIGDQENVIKEYVSKLGLCECVYFEGLQKDIPKYLKSFDVFLFPSIKEGLPVSVIEAQASGLKCFLSDTIDRTTDITGNVTFISLKSSPEYWAEKILSSFPYERVNCYEKVVAAGYDIYHNVERLQSLYNGEELV